MLVVGGIALWSLSGSVAVLAAAVAVLWRGRHRLSEAMARSRLGVQSAHMHLALLARAGDEMAPALESVEEALERLVDVVVPAFADWFAVDLVGDDGSTRRVASGGDRALDPGDERRAARREGLVGRAVSPRREQVAKSLVSGSPAVGDHRARVGARLAPGVESTLVVPVVVREDVVGALIFVTSPGRRGYRPSDIEIAHGVAYRVAVAVERVRLWRESRERERAAVEGEQRLRAVMDASPIAIAEMAPSGEPRWWNGTAAVLLGPEPGADGGPVWALLQPGSKAPWEAMVESARRAISTVGADIKVQRRGGELVELSVSSAPVLDAKGAVTGIVVVGEDVTLRRRMMDQAARTERLASMARLAGGLAHDFNNLLTVVLGWTSLLARHPQLDPVAREHTQAIEDAAKRAADLTAQLLALGRERPPDPKPIDPGAVLQAMRPMLQRVLGERVELEIASSGEHLRAVVDQADFERAVLNLAINAADAMPGGGTFVPRVFPAEGGDGTGQMVLVEASDTGNGMDAETAERCFEPFFSTKVAEGRGTGLGLFAVQAIAARAGGQVTVDSEPGRGTTFKMWLRPVGD